jgi:hypothetical protein
VQEGRLRRVEEVSYARGSSTRPRSYRTLKGADAVFFFGSTGDETAFIKEADAASWRPDIFLLGALTGRDLVISVPAGFGGKVFLSFPTIPPT